MGRRFGHGTAAIFLTLLLLAPSGTLLAADSLATARQAMVREIEAAVIETGRYLNQRALDPAVLAAMAEVPRHAFVPAASQSAAYRDIPLPIGHGQTISQPYIVALMTDLLRLAKNHRVLEIGTGSGYQAAILARLAAEVYTIEIIPALGEQATERLRQLGFGNVRTRIGDGYYGWEEEAPFDAIVVTAAASHIPPPLIKQLKPGGRMVIPVDSRFMVQQLVVVEKDQAGGLTTRQILPVRFVPLTGAH